MNSKKDHIDNLTPDIIKKYLKGELDNKQMHEVEKLMLNSDFDAEAMEGFAATGTHHLFHDLDLLKNKLNDRVKPKKKGIPLWLKVAASMAVLAISTFIILNVDFVDSTQKELTKSSKETSEPATEENASKADGDLAAADTNSSPDSRMDTDSLIALRKEETTAREKKLPPPAGQPVAPKQKGQAASGKADASLSDDDRTGKEKESPLHDIESAIAEEEMVEKEIVEEKEERFAEIAIVPEDDDSSGLDAPEMKKEIDQNLHLDEDLTRTGSKKTTNPQTSPARGKLIKGQITSAQDGSALPGVNVVVKGTSTGTVSDIEGKYQLSIPKQEDPVLTVGFIGYETEEVAVGDQAQVDVALESDVAQLSEVVITQRSTKEAPPDVVNMAKPAIGHAAFRKYIKNNLRYPSDTSGVKGKVIVTFNVSAKGELSDFNVTRSLGKAFDQEAIRVIKEGPAWSPATRNGIPEGDVVQVKVKFKESW